MPIPESATTEATDGAVADEAGPQDERSSEKSITAMVVWLLGAALTAGSAVAMAGSSGGETRPDPTPNPDPGPDQKPDEQKPPTPKPEEPTPEQPKPEQPKPEEPKPEQPKPEEPKPEEPKPEEPKPEEPKPEEPKPEEPKPDPGSGGDGVKPTLPTPNAPVLTLHSPDAIDGGLLGAAGEIRLGGLLADGTWQYSLDGGKIWHLGTGSTLAPSAFGDDGVKSVQVAQISAGGVRSPSRTLDFTLDTQAATVSLTLANDTGSSVSDGVTRDALVRIGGLETGLRWEYRIDGGSWTTGSGDEISAALFGRLNGERTLEIRHLDRAGNAGGTRLSFILDTEIGAPQVTLLNDTGTAGDLLTTDGTLTVSGIEPGATWSYRIGGGAWQVGAGHRIAGSEFQTTGRHQVEVRQTDAAGNVGQTSFEFTLAPLPTPLDLSLAADTGTPGDRITRDATIAVGGVDTGADWSYRIDGGAWKTSRGDRIPAGEFGADGRHVVEVKQTDAAGHERAATLDFTLDRAVAAPTLRLMQDTGASDTDGITSNAGVSIGGLETGATWEFSRDQLTWQAGVGTEIPASEFRGDGAKAVWARQIDAAGNVSASVALRFEVDSVALAPTLQRWSPFNDYYAQRPALANDQLATFHLGGALNPHGRVDVGVESGSRWVYSLNGGQDWLAGTGSSFLASTLTRDGAYELQVRQIDLAGNVSAERRLNFDFDMTAPTVSARMQLGGAKIDVAASEGVQLLLQAKGGKAIDVSQFLQSDGWGAADLLGAAGAKSLEAKTFGAVRDFNDDGNTTTLQLRQVFALYAIDQAGNAVQVPIAADGTIGTSPWIGMRTSPSGVDRWMAARTQSGTAGADVLLAGTDDFNVLTGGAGADTFRWQAALKGTSRTDVVTDYNFAEGDVLDLAAVVASIRATTPITQFYYDKIIEPNGDLLLTLSGSKDSSGVRPEVLTLSLSHVDPSTSIRVMWDGSTLVI